jgi:hypothetical protein
MVEKSRLGSLASLGFGLAALAKPDALASFTSLGPLDADGRSEIRTVFGGVFTTLGVLGLAGEQRPVTAVWGGLVLARLASLADSEARTADTLVGLLAEVVVLGLFLAGGEGATED